MTSDWLVGANRGAVASARIHAAAADLIARRGLDGLDMDELAARVHCSRATLYRHAGGKAQIRDAVLSRAAQRITEKVHSAVAGLAGRDRAVRAIEVALREIRADPVAAQLIAPSADMRRSVTLIESDALARFATELTGLDDDTLAAQWVVRVVLSLVLWPGADAAEERAMLDRFVASAFEVSG